MDSIILVSLIVLWIVVLFNLLLTFALIRRRDSIFEVPQQEKLPVGSIAPDFEAEMLTGERVSRTSLLGKATAFIFTTPNCQSCKELIPKIPAMTLQAKQAGVELMLVSLAEREQTEIYAKEHNLRLPIIVAPETLNPFSKDYKMNGTPYYCAFNEEGIIQSSGFVEIEWRRSTAQWGQYEVNAV